MLGDALCAFNPIYGQGMTVAGQSALVLDGRLEVATVDDVVAHRFLEVVHLLASPNVLFSPAIPARAPRGPRRPLFTAPPTATPLVLDELVEAV